MALHDFRPDFQNPDVAPHRSELGGGEPDARAPDGGAALLLADDAVSGLHWGEWRTGKIEGPAPATDHVHISVVQAGRGRFYRCDALGPREDLYRPGSINLTLPDPGGGTVACQPVALGVLGLPLRTLRAITAEYLDGRACRFDRLAQRLWESAPISAALLQLGQAARAGMLNAQALDHSAGVIGLSLALQLDGPAGRLDRLERDRGRLTAIQVSRVEAHVAEHLAQSVTVEELAGVVQLGARHFTRLFKNGFGMPPYAYVMEQRLLRSRQLLGPGSVLPVTEVAMALGFSSAAAFATAFRRRFGAAPSRERRRIRS